MKTKYQKLARQFWYEYEPQLIEFLKTVWYDDIHIQYIAATSHINKDLLAMWGWAGVPNKYIAVYKLYKAIRKITGAENYKLAIFLYKKYWVKIKAKMKVHFNIGKIAQPLPENNVHLFREFVARGFIPKQYAKNINFKKDYYVQCNIFPLVIDEAFDNQQSAYELMEDYGIRGYTGIHTPKS